MLYAITMMIAGQLLVPSYSSFCSRFVSCKAGCGAVVISQVRFAIKTALLNYYTLNFWHYMHLVLKIVGMSCGYIVYTYFYGSMYSVHGCDACFRDVE